MRAGLLFAFVHVLLRTSCLFVSGKSHRSGGQYGSTIFYFAARLIINWRGLMINKGNSYVAVRWMALEHLCVFFTIRPSLRPKSVAFHLRVAGSASVRGKLGQFVPHRESPK